MGKQGRLLIAPCRRSFGRRSPVVDQFEERRLSCVCKSLLLFAAEFEYVTPENAFAFDLKKLGACHFLLRNAPS